MADDMRRALFGVLMAVLGLLGLVLFGNARDVGIELFGFGLMVFAVLFGRALIARHFEEAGK